MPGTGNAGSGTVKFRRSPRLTPGGVTGEVFGQTGSGVYGLAIGNHGLRQLEKRPGVGRR